MAQHNDLGKKGEQLAVDFLIKKGYKIREQNFRHQKAEVDIIAQKENTLCAVEVKTRSTPEFGNPQDFVKPQQIQRLVNAIDYYVNENNLDVDVRFDIVAIIKNKQGTKLEHLEDAFLFF
ncbi:YraN family protein [Mesonia aquimarina]|uniref:YraN family protein n=1 Tax=Mesonia aquimarina TaxID=1504967 RepID=UPI000EF5FF78|nr:YraN family protein [Mesonia aquimarina]